MPSVKVEIGVVMTPVPSDRSYARTVVTLVDAGGLEQVQTLGPQDDPSDDGAGGLRYVLLFSNVAPGNCEVTVLHQDADNAQLGESFGVVSNILADVSYPQAVTLTANKA